MYKMQAEIASLSSRIWGSNVLCFSILGKENHGRVDVKSTRPVYEVDNNHINRPLSIDTQGCMYSCLAQAQTTTCNCTEGKFRTGAKVCSDISEGKDESPSSILVHQSANKTDAFKIVRNYMHENYNKRLIRL